MEDVIFDHDEGEEEVGEDKKGGTGAQGAEGEGLGGQDTGMYHDFRITATTPHTNYYGQGDTDDPVAAILAQVAALREYQSDPPTGRQVAFTSDINRLEELLKSIGVMKEETTSGVVELIKQFLSHVRSNQSYQVVLN